MLAFLARNLANFPVSSQFYNVRFLKMATNLTCWVVFRKGPRFMKENKIVFIIKTDLPKNIHNSTSH